THPVIWQAWAAVDRPPARGRQPWRRHLAPASHGSAAGNPLSVLRSRQSSRAPTACLGQPQRRGCTRRRLELGAVPVPVVRDPVLSIGSLFAGGYEVLAPLGEGSFGRVYKGRQRSTGQAVAIKTLRLRQGDAARDVENQIARFRREMRLCAELSHPHIVRLIDSGESEDGTLYTVFEYVPGATLREVLAREGS